MFRLPTSSSGRFVGLLDALEEGFYWLISATVLAYLTLGIFGL
jgi:hypothetical protein